MKKFSIKAKITLWYTLIIFVISVMTLFIMMSVSREILIRDSSEKLVHSVERIVPMVNAPINDMPKPPPIPKDDLGRIPGFHFFNNGVHTAVYDEEGNIINGAIPFEFADDIDFINETVQEKDYAGNSFLTYTKKTVSKDNTVYWLVGVISIANEGALLQSVSKTNLILIAVLIFVAALGGYLILKQAFRPVDKIRKTAKLISESNDLSQRISLNTGNDEIHRLADTFDAMLDKIEKTLNNEKQFTSDASHELRTPVAVIASECEYTLECAKTLDEAKESVVSIKHQADKMSRLIAELLSISRMDKNTTDINYENIDISELLNFVCDEQEEIHDLTIALNRNITPDIVIKTDSLLLARVFINLISNAYSYGKENGHINISLSEKNNEIIFEVSDDGIGIAEENLDKIWERFYQVNTSRTNESGCMGLGLSMVKLIADKLGGRVDVKSKYGDGSTFTFVLPNTV